MGGFVKININDLSMDNDIYPRIEKSPATILDYTEKLRAGVEFPSIETQRIQENGTVKTIILDGYHRWQAYLAAYQQPEISDNGQPNYSEIEANYWKDEILDKVTHLNDLRLRSIELNLTHGIRLDRKDLKAQAEQIARDDPEHKLSAEKIAQKWGLARKTVSDWVSNIRASQKAKRDRIIFKLSMLGWTQEEIAETTGITQGRISQNINNGEIAKINNSISDWLSQGKTVEEAAEKLEIDATLAWAIHLQGKDDDTRLDLLTKGLNDEKIKLSPNCYDVWNYSKCMPLTGKNDYPGRIPGQLIINILYFFTSQGDLVIDPMAGGGTTLDACLLMNRQNYSYDIIPSRDDILYQDILLLVRKHKASLVFLDAPYFLKKAKEYSLPEWMHTKDGFLIFMDKCVDACDVFLNKDGIVALLISDYVDYENPFNSIFSYEYLKSFMADGYVLLYKISCPLSTEQYQSFDVTRAQNNKELLIRGRELYILQKNG